MHAPFLRTALALFILTLAVTSMAEPGAQSNQPAVDHTVAYRTTAERDLRVDVMVPRGWSAGDSRGSIVLFHGGGWSGGAPSQFARQGRALADRGMVVFLPEYRLRLTDKTGPEDAVHDARAAMRWVRDHAGDWGVDPGRIAAGGGSAGGHLALATALLPDLDDDPTTPALPVALVLFNPVVDLETMNYDYPGLTAERRRALSPIHDAGSPALPPTLFLHGTADATAPIDEVRRFAALARGAGHDCRVAEYEGAPHAFFNPGAGDGSWYHETLAETIRFLEERGLIKAMP